VLGDLKMLNGKDDQQLAGKHPEPADNHDKSYVAPGNYPRNTAHYVQHVNQPGVGGYIPSGGYEQSANNYTQAGQRGPSLDRGGSANSMYVHPQQASYSGANGYNPANYVQVGPRGPTGDRSG